MKKILPLLVEMILFVFIFKYIYVSFTILDGVIPLIGFIICIFLDIAFCSIIGYIIEDFIKELR